MRKDKPKVKKIEEEMLSPKTNQGVPLHEGCHTWRGNVRRANLVDDLIHRTDSPFTASINSYPLPPKFKMPSLDSYDGTRDPFDHIATFKTTMHL